MRAGDPRLAAVVAAFDASESFRTPLSPATSNSYRFPVRGMSPCSMKYRTPCRSIGVHSVFSRYDQLNVTFAFVQSTPRAANKGSWPACSN